LDENTRGAKHRYAGATPRCRSRCLVPGVVPESRPLR
jgi:hypothetical protein